MAEDLCYVKMFIILHAWLAEHIYAGNIRISAYNTIHILQQYCLLYN